MGAACGLARAICIQADAGKLCRCVNTNEIRDRIVVPIIQKTAAGTARFFNIDNPKLEVDDEPGPQLALRKPTDRVTMVFTPSLIVNHQSVTDGFDILIVIDPCSDEVLGTTCSAAVPRTYLCPPELKLPSGALCEDAIPCGE